MSSILRRFVRAVSQARDTTTFSDRSGAEYKRNTQTNWSEVPCGTNYTAAPRYTKEYFDELEAYRYRVQDWLADALSSLDVSGRRVLEIGYGAGSDHRRLAEQGCELVGIDLTLANVNETRKHLEAYGHQAHLVVGDAERMPYGDESFGFVYSFGVIHHSPDTDAIIREIHRILAPGGKGYITVYHKNSIFFWWNIFLYSFLIKGGWKRRTLQGQLSLVEYPNTNEGMVFRLYRKREFASALRRVGLRVSRIYVRHLVPADVAGLPRIVKDPARPRWWLSALGRLWGWYVVAEIEKP